MEWVSLLLELGFTPLNILLIAMFYFVLAEQGVMPKFWSRNKSDDDGGGETPEWARRLEAYFNHDTTEYHERTHDLLKEMASKLDRHNEMEKENHAKLQEILTYGVPCRDKRQ